MLTQDPATDLSAFTNAHFASRLVGNLGAALDCDDEAYVDQYTEGDNVEEQQRQLHALDNPLLADLVIDSERGTRRPTLRSLNLKSV